MRKLLLAIFLIVLLVIIWLLFFNFSTKCVSSYIDTLENHILPLTEGSSWESSLNEIENFNVNWHKYREIALFFLDTNTINEIDYSLAKAIKYIKAEDVSNASGELNNIIEQLVFLNYNQCISLSNIL